MNSWKRVAATLGLVCGVLFAPGAEAQAPAAETDVEGTVVVPEGWAYKMAAELLSPFCPGRTLAECPSPDAESLRLWIILQEAAGRTRVDVEEELYARYGDDIRSAPRAEGIGITAYAFPIVAFIGGGVFIAWFLGRKSGGGGPESSSEEALEAELDPELARVVDEEIRG